MGSREVNDLTGRQKAIVVGKILGDGTLEKNGRFTRLRVAQNYKQKDYVFWLYKELKEMVTKSPRYLKSSIRHRRSGQYRFDTFSIPIFNRYRDIFYHKRRKIVPYIIKELLTDSLSLAVWYMDDGYKRIDKSGLYLCTSGFTDKEQILLQNCLSENFRIKTNIHYAGGYPRIHIPSTSKNKFCDYVRPFMLPSFNYKLL